MRFPIVVDAAAGDDRFDSQWKPIRYMLNALSGEGGGPDVVRAQARSACAAMGAILRALPGVAGVDQATFLLGFTPVGPAGASKASAEVAADWEAWNGFFYSVAVRPNLDLLDRDEAQALAEEFQQTLSALDEFVWTRLTYWNEQARALAEGKGWLS